MIEFSLDMVPYEFIYDGGGQWTCEDFTAFDIQVKSRFTEKYQGKQIGDDFLYITHDEDKLLTICCPDDRSQEEQADLIAEFFSIYFDALNEIGYETLDPAPQ